MTESGGRGAAPGAVDAYEYCRQIETYLCRKNEGHLIRIVGPVFEQVCGWAERGVPLKIALRGIDRYCERYYARGARRRPVRVEFCEADVLELFDDWRRAVGATAGREDVERSPRRPGLPTHLERVIARLSGRRGDEQRSASFRQAIDGLVRALDELSPSAAHARAAARAAIVERLAELDRTLLTAAVSELTPDAEAALRREAAVELAAFGSRMTLEARDRATAAAVHRLVRERFELPTVAYDP